MNTFWLKLAGVAILAIVIVIVIGIFTSSEKPEASVQDNVVQENEQKPAKSVQEQWERDERKYSVKEDVDNAEPSTAQPVQPIQPAQPKQKVARQPHFEKLSLEDEVQAQKLFEMAKMEFKQSRLPLMTPKRMIDYCREIIQKWPQSEYAYQSKRMLADIPRRHKKAFGVTEQEMDLSNFYK